MVPRRPEPIDHLAVGADAVFGAHRLGHRHHRAEEFEKARPVGERPDHELRQHLVGVACTVPSVALALRQVDGVVVPQRSRKPARCAAVAITTVGSPPATPAAMKWATLSQRNCRLRRTASIRNALAIGWPRNCLTCGSPSGDTSLIERRTSMACPGVAGGSMVATVVMASPSWASEIRSRNSQEAIITQRSMINASLSNRR